MFEYLLPIGTVVKLKDAEKYLMIFGILQNFVKEDGANNQFDYIGVPYPVGYLNNQINIGFNHSQIEAVIFRGYENGDEWKNFKRALNIAQAINKKKRYYGPEN